MILEEIIRLIRNNIYLLIILVTIIIMIIYLILHKKLRNSKIISEKQMILFTLLLGYIFIIIILTILSRSIGYYDSVNLSLFRSYRLAWYNYNISNWLHIILNIVMLIPFGILLPLCNYKFYKLKWTVLTGFAFVLLIETLQLITNRGVFDIDDIFNNMIGVLIGYGIVLGIITLIKKQKKEYLNILLYFTPLIIVASLFVGMFLYYNNKEFGNLSISAYIDKINFKNMNINYSTKLSKEKAFVPIYRTSRYNVNSAKDFAVDFLKNINVETEDLILDIYSVDYVNFHTKDNKFSIKINLLNGSYDYTNFSENENAGPIEIDEEYLKQQLNYFNIVIPKETSFNSYDKGSYIWEIERVVNDDTLTEGSLSCLCYEDGTFENISNDIIKYVKVRDVGIISEAEAVEKITQGKFSIYGSSNPIESIKSMGLIEIKLDYKLDSKGFYQPVYLFNSEVDGYECEITVSALIK